MTGYVMVPMAEITLGDRRRADYGDIAKLAAGIKRVGLLHPLIVKRVSGQGFTIIAGGRRFKALGLLGHVAAPVRLFGDLSDAEVRDIELEENENRKEFTDKERRRTFAASKQLVADAKKVGVAISTRGVGIKKPGQKPAVYSASRVEIGKVLDVSPTAIVKAEQHVEIVEHYPHMQGWRQSEVLAMRECLETLPATERDEAAGVVACAKLMDPDTAVELIENIAAMTPEARKEVYVLSKSEDPRDRSKALSTAAKNPPLPDPRLNLIDAALTAISRATKPYPNDPLTPRLKDVAQKLRVIKTQVEAVSHDARRQAGEGSIQ